MMRCKFCGNLMGLSYVEDGVDVDLTEFECPHCGFRITFYHDNLTGYVDCQYTIYNKETRRITYLGSISLPGDYAEKGGEWIFNDIHHSPRKRRNAPSAKKIKNLFVRALKNKTKKRGIS